MLFLLLHTREKTTVLEPDVLEIFMLYNLEVIFSNYFKFIIFSGSALFAQSRPSSSGY